MTTKNAPFVPHVIDFDEQLLKDPKGELALEIFVDHLYSEMDNDGTDPSKLKELLHWLDMPDTKGPRQPRLTYREAVHRALKTNTLDECKAALRESLPKPAGRPATKRIPAIKAFVFRRFAPKVHWSQIVSRVCTCGNATHGESCIASLQAEVRQLRAVLKKYGMRVW
jgi:hypothetical protein